MISIEGVGFRYAGSEGWALRGVTARIEKGELTLLVGRSGAGKSTLLRTLNGLIPHFYPGEMEGKVVVDGVDTREVPVSEMARRVGLVFQNPENQLVTLRVDREIAFGLENIGMEREEIKERVRWAMETLGIEELRKKTPFELSGGQKQLVAVASVLAMQPDYLALDEPTSELDPKSAELLFGGVRKLVELGKAVIVSEHRLDLFGSAADRVIVMNRGRVVAQGPPEEIFSSERVKSWGISPPRTVQIYMEITKMGSNPWNKVPLSVEDCAAGIRRLVG